MLNKQLKSLIKCWNIKLKLYTNLKQCAKASGQPSLLYVVKENEKHTCKYRI